MKKLSTVFLFSFLFIGIVLFSCDKQTEEVNPEQSIIPESFSIEIPDALSNETVLNSSDGSAGGRFSERELNGNKIYRHLNLFIHIGQKSSQLVQEIMQGIRKHNINGPVNLSFESGEDGRLKNLRVTENSGFENTTWKYELLITDAASEGEADGGKALQVFWNTNPVEGVAILKPFNINRSENSHQAIFRIDYSEASTQEYDAHMTVQIARLPLSDAISDRFAMNSLKMFVGRKGDLIDIYGNSDHPNAYFFTEKMGYSWAFVASGNKKENTGVAELGLPFRDLDSSERSILLEEYAVKTVFTREISEAFQHATPEQTETMLLDTEGPGYFHNGGFINGGISPDAKFDELEERISVLAPYNPKNIAALEINFK